MSEPTAADWMKKAAEEICELFAIRHGKGMLMPAPQQVASIIAMRRDELLQKHFPLDDAKHRAEQREADAADLAAIATAKESGPATSYDEFRQEIGLSENNTAPPAPVASRCDHCGTECIDDCYRCGAPQCCPKCCEQTLRSNSSKSSNS